MPRVLAIVGSTVLDSTNPLVIDEIIEAIYFIRPDKIISGGAKGVDTAAKTIANSLNIEFEEYLPENTRWQPNGYKARNLLIAENCTHLISIRSTKSRTYGSGWTADRAEEMDKAICRVQIDPDDQSIVEDPSITRFKD